MAIFVLGGGVAYFAWTFLAAASETADAQTSAAEVIASLDPGVVVDELVESDQTPASLPFVTETPTTDASPPATSARATTTIPETPVIDSPNIALAFINRVPGDQYGLVGYVDDQGERIITDLECARLDVNSEGGICLSATAGFGGTGRGYILDAALTPSLRFAVNEPSRAAVSPDGSVVAWTGFSLGHSYLNAGEFATTTQLIEIDRFIGVNLEDGFRTYENEIQNDDFERNYWGVTFIDNDRFYATLGLPDRTAIVEGSISNSRIDVVFPNATCPEVSPDGATIVAKERRGDFFQLIAIDVSSGNRRDLGEVRSVGDQVEWADEDTILYAMPNPGAGTDAQPAFDIYALDLAIGATPRLLLPFADSPAA